MGHIVQFRVMNLKSIYIVSFWQFPLQNTQFYDGPLFLNVKITPHFKMIFFRLLLNFYSQNSNHTSAIAQIGRK